MEASFFTVQATLAPGSSRDDVSAMLHNVLVERFRLDMKREPKDRKGYVLKLGSRTPNLRESPPAARVALRS